MNMKRTLSLLLAAVLALALLTGCGGKQASDSSPEDQTVPNEPAGKEGAAALGSLTSFSAGTLDGGTFTQEDIAAKDLTAINFWGTFCSPCIAEMPDLAAFEKALPDNVAMLTVCLDGYGNEDSVKEVLENAGFEGVTLITGEGDLLDLANNLMYTPTTVLADSQKEITADMLASGAYLEAVNQALEAGGKDAISLEDA